MSVYKTLNVDLDERSYDIVIGNDLLSDVGKHLKDLLPGRQVGIVTNVSVAPLYLEKVKSSLIKAGFEVVTVILSDGESHKNWVGLQKILDRLIESRFERSSTLLALGGGVIGDITGFAASTLLRGVNFVQVPTTLLAQVDASVGGKTAINHTQGKNLIGTFYQPRRVVIDLETLKTLPKREIQAGMAEAIKYGVINDAELFEFMEEELDDILALKDKALAKMIYGCCKAKAKMVEKDEKEKGVRALLNLGHTFGHGIEVLTHYKSLLHGEAVAVGMVMAAELSRLMSMCDDSDVERIDKLLKRVGLPTVAPRFSIDHYMEAMTRDKKVEGGQNRFILIKKIGEAVTERNIPTDLLRETLSHHMTV